jgi:serine protease Do
VGFAGETPTDERELLRMIAASAPGRQVTLTVLRDGKTVDLPTTLGEWPRMAWEERDAPTVVAPPHWNVPPDLGAQVTELTDKLAAENEIPQQAPAAKAVLVQGVAQDTEAARAGIAVGDVILRLDRTEIGTQADWLKAIAAARAGGRKFAMLLLLPKAVSDTDMRTKAPKWMPVRIASE